MATTKIAVGNQRADTSVRNWAIGVLVMAFVSLLFNPFAVLSVLVVVSGISWFVAMARDGQYARRLGGVFVPCVIAVIVGVLLASLTTFAGVVRLLA